MTITIATRGSALARWQAEHVATALRAAADEPIDVVLDVIETRADRRLDIPIWEMGGKGVFVKEVQARVLDGTADLAVHSGKDLPARTPDALVIAAVPERADAGDVLVGYAPLDDLPAGAVVATGSVRRRAQLAHHRPDLTFSGLRGNIATRLGKVPDGGAVVMAAAAIDRLDLTAELAGRGLVADPLPASIVLPQVAQGALAVECRADDRALIALLARIEHAPSRLAVDAERAFLDELGGDCDLPAGAHATVAPAGRSGTVRLDGVLASLDGHTVLRHAVDGAAADAAALGRSVARFLLDDRGGAALLGR